MSETWSNETKTIELTKGETVSLLSSLLIQHNNETGYSIEGYLEDHYLIQKLIDVLESYSSSNTGDGVPR